MTSFCYEAVDSGGLKMEGSLEVTDQGEALRRIRQMGLFPVKVAEHRAAARRFRNTAAAPGRKSWLKMSIFEGRPKQRAIGVFTRQLATLLDAGMPLLRGLRTLREQEEHPALKRMLGEMAVSIEGGSSLSEALAKYPRVFSALYSNMVRAGELGGALEITLRRLAEFIEKAQRIKTKVRAAMFYPCAVLIVAVGIMVILMAFVVPRFQEVFTGLMNGASLPPFTSFVLGVSDLVKAHFEWAAIGAAALGAGFALAVRTRGGRRLYDRAKLTMPLLGPIFRKLAIARFSRTLGTLLNSGVPVLQALTVVRETAGNVIVGAVIGTIHDSVKEGETVAAPIRQSNVFPAMVAGMVDVGEQTGALPDMLMKIADTYDEEVDNAVSSMTSLLEPIMIIFLAVVVGSIVIAMFLPLTTIMNQGFDSHGIGDM